MVVAAGTTRVPVTSKTDAAFPTKPIVIFSDLKISNFKAMSGYYFAQSTKIHEEYNWIKLTKNAFKHLEERFS